MTFQLLGLEPFAVLPTITRLFGLVAIGQHPVLADHLVLQVRHGEVGTKRTRFPSWMAGVSGGRIVAFLFVRIWEKQAMSAANNFPPGIFSHAVLNVPSLNHLTPAPPSPLPIPYPINGGPVLQQLFGSGEVDLLGTTPHTDLGWLHM